jgi:uncharacterized membrane protein YvbJ
MIIKCPECGHQVSDRAKVCPSCGIDIAGKVTRCPDCGEIIFKDEAECPNCHCPINLDALPPVEETREMVAPTVPQPEPDAPVAAKPVKKRKTGRIVIVLSAVIALIIVLVGFYFYKTQEQENELRAYENAWQSDQPAVLQNYLDMYLQAPMAHRDSIKARLQALRQIDIDWDNAQLSGSKAEIEKYMKRHPNSIHNVEAKLLIDSLDWVAACMDDTSESYQTYLSAHYDGAHYDEAMNALDRKREEEAARRRQAIEDSLRAQDSARTTVLLLDVGE